MKRPRHWKVALASLLMAASLVCAPLEGSAKALLPQFLPGDPRPTQEMDGPDVPPLPGTAISGRVLISTVLVALGIQPDVATAVMAARLLRGTRFTQSPRGVVVPR